MKRFLSVFFVLLLMIICLTSCNFTQNMSGALAGSAEATSKVEEVMKNLAEDGVSDSKSLMHPRIAEKSEAALTQICDYLDGREASSIEVKNINISTSTGTSGKVRQEQVVYQVTLDDGAVIYLNVDYLSDNEGTGFVSFQLVLGVV